MRESASVLSFMHRFPEALELIAKAEAAFQDVPCPEFELARLKLVKASALQLQDGWREAAQLAREAGALFLRFNDRPRHITARITEAALMSEGGELEKALEIWQSLENDPGLDAMLRVTVKHNICFSLCALGRRLEAVAPLEECIAEWERLGELTERTRSRWHLGNALTATPRQQEAIALLRTAWREFTEQHLMVDAALTALDLADALLVLGEPNQVADLCREVITQLTNAGLAKQALPAFAMLREAAQMGRASRALIRDTSVKVKRMASERALFAPGRE